MKMVQSNQLETSRIRGPAGDGYVCRGVWQGRRNKHLFVADEVKDLMCACCGPVL